MYIAAFEELLAFTTSTAVPDEFVMAKKDYFKLSGEIGDDEPSYNHRIQAFLEWYLFDRKLVMKGVTPLEMFLSGRTMPPEEAERFNGFFNTVWGLFELKRIGRDHLKLRDLWSGEDYNVLERRLPIGLSRGELLETRIIPYAEHLLLSHSIILHPKEAASLIKKGIKKVKKEGVIERFEYFQHLSYARLKLDRYAKPLKLESIYESPARGEYIIKP
ncbi:MAG: hypothetical protein Kow0090_11800 [Myxococcota bacterium]